MAGGPTDGDRRRGLLVLLATSPRVAPGLLGVDAWDVLRRAAVITCGRPDHPQLAALAAAGVAVEVVERGSAGAGAVAELVDQLVQSAASAAGSPVVHLIDPSGDEPLVHALASTVVADPGALELELLAGSYDLPGAHLLDLVQVMDRLRSPGGCPWDAEQDHESLLRYLVEEAYELVEAIEASALVEGHPDGPAHPTPTDLPGDASDLVAARGHVREELGDLLLQVVFHARVAEEHATHPFSVDDVADGIVTKLVERHPHVFVDPGAAAAASSAHLEATWERQKAAAKGRASVADGIPPGLPALATAEKLLGRASRAGLDVPLPISTPDATSDDDLGDVLLRLVDRARGLGVDPEAALRRAVRRHATRVRAAEQAPARDPGTITFT